MVANARPAWAVAPAATSPVDTAVLNAVAVRASKLLMRVKIARVRTEGARARCDLLLNLWWPNVVTAEPTYGPGQVDVATAGMDVGGNASNLRFERWMWR